MEPNLNDLLIEGDQYNEKQKLQDYSCSSQDGQTEVVFRDLENRLIKFIQETPIIVGCVAWLPHPRILQALAACEAIALVVQKEDFLRPDLAVTQRKSWANQLRALYEKLPGKLSRDSIDGTLYMMSYAGSPEIAAVRCVGNYNAARLPAFPRMHHKFIVACRWAKRTREFPYYDSEGRFIEVTETYGIPEPYAVWTGSFNFTKNAGYSLENALILRDPQIVRAYYDEWNQIEALSEQLDWYSEWVEPEWRIGS